MDINAGWWLHILGDSLYDRLFFGEGKANHMGCYTSIHAFESCSTEKDMEKNMNVVLITLDAVRPDRLGCYGYSKGLTPNIDSIAENGAVFTNAYCQAPITLVSLSSFLTGLLPYHHKVRNNGLYVLDRGISTLATILREHGYATGAFVGGFPLHSQFGLDRGFHYYDDDFFDSPLEKKLYEWGVCRGRTLADSPALGPGKFSRRASTVTQSAIDWMGQHGTDRLFIWMHYFDAHIPYALPLAVKIKNILRVLLDQKKLLFKRPEDFSSKGVSNGSLYHHMRRQLGRPYLRKVYDWEIGFIDRCLGQLFAFMRKEKSIENTLFIIAADHGEAFEEHGLRGHSLMLYEEMVRIPLIISCPGLLPRGRTASTLASSVDIVPTVLDALHISCQPAQEFDGTSLIQYVDHEHKEETQREIYCETLYPRENWGKPAYVALIRQNWKLIMEVDGSQIMLFDLSSDPGEQVNVAAKYPEIVAEMSAKLLAIKSTDDYHAKEIDEADEAVKEALKALGYLG